MGANDARSEVARRLGWHATEWTDQRSRTINSGSGRLIAPLTEAGAHVVVVTGSSDRPLWGKCLRLGARSVLTKTKPLIRLWESHSQERRQMIERLRLLTMREQEVLAHLMQGHLVREIATIGVVSEATVRTQVKSILAKLEVSSQLAAVGAANNVAWRPPSAVAI